MKNLLKRNESVCKRIVGYFLQKSKSEKLFFRKIVCADCRTCLSACGDLAIYANRATCGVKNAATTWSL
ncbi:MAG: hypothetical protein DWH82_11295 [Planctomycetota bacterium]|nr:MAG: hypothetical protein DWH82_11295 [Planctomycetota bacterium]